MKEKTNTYMNYSNKEMELTRKEFVKRWMEVATDCNKLIDWRDIDGTEKKVNKIKKLIENLAGYNFDLKQNDVHIYYGMDGVESHRVGKEYLIRNGKEVIK